MRRFSNDSFTIEIDPSVWKQVSVIPQESFRLIQDTLRDRADRLSAGLQNSVPTMNRVQQVRVGNYVAICEVDVPMRTLRLVMVKQATSL